MEFKSKKLKTYRCRMVRSELLFFWMGEELRFVYLKKGDLVMAAVEQMAKFDHQKESLVFVPAYARLYLSNDLEVLVRSNIFEVL